MARDELLLSDLSQPDAPASWRGFSDQVMGGISQEQVTVELIADQPCLRLSGAVRLENQGGFVQMALPLERGGGPLDGRAQQVPSSPCSANRIACRHDSRLSMTITSLVPARCLPAARAGACPCS